MQPLLRPPAILENVSGILIVSQHSGEGKANQYFMRAFNLDHGTDLALEVDDMPVNMSDPRSHHQGYSDLNFLIPELTADLHYKKGSVLCGRRRLRDRRNGANLPSSNALPTSIEPGRREKTGIVASLLLGSAAIIAGGHAAGGRRGLSGTTGRFDVSGSITAA